MYNVYAAVRMYWCLCFGYFDKLHENIMLCVALILTLMSMCILTTLDLRMICISLGLILDTDLNVQNIKFQNYGTNISI